MLQNLQKGPAIEIDKSFLVGADRAAFYSGSQNWNSKFSEGMRRVH